MRIERYFDPFLLMQQVLYFGVVAIEFDKLFFTCYPTFTQEDQIKERVERNREIANFIRIYVVQVYLLFQTWDFHHVMPQL